MRRTSALRRLLCVSLICVTAANVALQPPVAAQPPADDEAAVRSLRRSAGPSLRVARDSRTGRVRFLGSAQGRPIESRRSSRGLRPDAVARDFLQRNAGLLGGPQLPTDLRLLRTSKNRSGTSAVRFQQQAGGVPVLGGEFVVSLDRDNGVLSVSGEGTAVRSLPPVQPAVTAERAAEVAAGIVARDRRISPRAVTADPAELNFFDPGLLGIPGAATVSLVWRVQVHAVAPADFNRLVLVDARTGYVRLNIDPDPRAKNRFVCDHDNRRVDDDACRTPFDITEGSSTARASQDAVNAYLYAGDTYDYFYSRFGRDSLDGKGLPLKSTVRYCPEENEEDALPAPCPYPNAYWNGDLLQMVYGAGFASADDVVAHELTHGVTQFEANLFSLYQSGAVNESISDVFGELIDQYNATLRTRGRDTTGDGGSVDYRWLLFEDGPGGFGRNMRDPRVFKEPDRIRSGYYAAENEWSDAWDNGGVHSNSGVGNKAAYLMAVGGAFNNRNIDPANALGNEKLGQLWYRALTQHLTSGSDYADLADALRQSCAELVAEGPMAVAGMQVTFIDTDCATVFTAVDATEMYLQPIVRKRTNKDGSVDVLDATNPEAPVCSDGEQPSYQFYDHLEHPKVGNWVTSRRVGERDWYYPQNPNPFGIAIEYAKSGRTHMFGDDPEGRSDFAITTQRAFVPTATSYLRVDHAFVFDFNYDTGVGVDSGVVEYSVDDGKTFTRLQPESGEGYGPVADRTAGNNSSIQGPAFVGDSHGYVSSRFFLGDLAGQPVQIRFRIATDSRFGNYGWFVDDVRIYDCAAGNVAPSAPPPPPAITSVTPTEDGLAVRWTAQTRPTGILGYTIIARSAGHTATVSTPAGTSGYTLRGLSGRASYVVTVRARSAFGDALSEPVGPVSPADARSPAPPRAVTVAPGIRAAVVAWTADPNSFPSGARVVVKAGASAPRTGADGRAVEVARGASVRVGGLLPATPYSFAVFARSGDGRLGTAAGTARVRGSEITIATGAPGVGGAPVDVTGVLRDHAGVAVPGARVDLHHRRPGRAWTLYDVMTTGPSGRFAFQVAATPGEIQARFRGGPGVLGSVSAAVPHRAR